jgi:hypothetical protein
MSDFGISGVAGPQPQDLQAVIATKIKQPSVSAQADAVRTVGAVSDQIAAALASISSGVNIQA